MLKKLLCACKFCILGGGTREDGKYRRLRFLFILGPFAYHALEALTEARAFFGYTFCERRCKEAREEFIRQQTE